MKLKRIPTKPPILPCLLALSAAATAADLHVPADYSTIQAAADAANANDTIHIAAGVYVEKLTIKRKSNITLIGQPGTIVRAFPNMPHDDDEWGINSRSVLYINLSQDIAIRNIAFEGDQLGNDQERRFNGIYFLDSGGSVENCRITGFRERVPAGKPCFGLRFLNNLDFSPVGTASVIGNTIEDCYGGIQLIGAPTSRVTIDFLIKDNTIRGVGPTEARGTLRGLDLANRISGSVVNNTVSGFSHIDNGQGAAFPYGYGLLAYGSGWPNRQRTLDPIRIEGNNFVDNNLHITVLNATDECLIANNRIEGSAPTNRPVGLWVSGKNVPVKGNDFIDLEEGIRLAGEDPEYGDVLGFADNVRIEGNRFTDVVNKFNYQPQATATETNNMDAPFPPPELEIETAITISWPSYYEGWSLQESADLEDWTPLDLLFIEHEGISSVTVPTGEPHKLFRLVEGGGSQ